MVISSRSALVKVAVIAILALALLIPLGLLRSLVSERTSMRDFAFEQVANGWGGGQRGAPRRRISDAAGASP